MKPQPTTRRQTRTEKGNTRIYWDQVLTNHPISGFGAQGAQLYIKAGFAITPLHDELGWSCALNYMTHASQGIALWIGLNLPKVVQNQVMTHEELVHYMEHDNVLEFIATLVNRLESNKMCGNDIDLCYCWQYPGQMVSSPASDGCAHLVISMGDYIEQIALNDFATPNGIKACLDFWSTTPRVSYNSGLATEEILPCMWLQDKLGYDLGLHHRIQQIKRAIGPIGISGGAESSEESNIIWVNDETNSPRLNTNDLITNKEEIYMCSQCNKEPLFVLRNGVCERCILV
jgi:hypothetical protein